MSGAVQLGAERLDSADGARLLGELMNEIVPLGYVEIADYNTNPFASYWFEKRL